MKNSEMILFEYAKHYQLWHELYLNPHLFKKDVFKMMRWPEVSKDCFACEYADMIFQRKESDGDLACKYCPIDWPETNNPVKCQELYTQWENAKSKGRYEEAKRLAYKIQNIPPKPGIPLNFSIMP